jgi:glycerophosphoryl diester phosphodiesterase
MVFSCHQNKKQITMSKKIVIAHRGASGYLPEHTLEAKAMAHAMNTDFIEQDLVLSKDNIPIVIHDIYLDDVTNVAATFPNRKRKDHRFYVIDFTFDELKTLQVTERFNPKTGEQVYKNRFPKGKGNFKIHSLQEEIELIQGLNTSTKKNIGIYPEIKAPEFHQKEGKNITEIILKVLANYGYKTKKDNCILQCFNAKELERIRKELKSELFLVQLIEHPKQAKELKHFATYADGIGPWYKQILASKVKDQYSFTSLVSDAHQLGLKVHPYTFRADALAEFDTFEQMMQTLLIEANVDGVFTDFPDIVINFLKENNNNDY